MTPETEAALEAMRDNPGAISHHIIATAAAIALNEIKNLQFALEKAAGRLTWCAGIIQNDDVRDLAGGWADEARDAICTEKDKKEPDDAK